MKKIIWVPRTAEWIRNNPGKGTMYKIDSSEQPPITASASIKKIYQKNNTPIITKGEDAGIYAVICNATKSAYIGQSTNMDSRMRNHKMMIIGTQEKCSVYIRMKKDYQQFGIESFDFIKCYKLPFYTNENLWVKEQETMWEYIEKGYTLYNIAVSLGDNVIYCPIHLKDLITKFIISAKEDSTMIDKLVTIL